MNYFRILAVYSLFVAILMAWSLYTIFSATSGAFVQAAPNMHYTTLLTLPIQTDSQGFPRTSQPHMRYSYPFCDGEWIDLHNGMHIDLTRESIATWDIQSEPAVLEHTINQPNTVVIGHNYCNGKHCNAPTTDFAHIIEVNIGNTITACINNQLYSGEVTFAQTMSEYDTFILGNWQNSEVLTLFTCFGKCYDTSCTRTDQRWVVVVEKHR